MIENGTLYCMYFGVIMAFLLPLIIMCMGIAFNKMRIAPIFVGMIVYFLSSYMIRLPMVLGLTSIGVYESLQANELVFPVVSSLMISVSLGIGRVLGWLPSRKNHDYKGALSIGFGMGALDCIMMLGMDMFSTMMLAKAYNGGTFEAMVEGMDPEYVIQLTNALTQTEGYVYILSSLERVMLMILEMVMAVLLYKFWQKRKLFEGTFVTMGVSWFIIMAASLLYSMNIYLGAIYLVICGAVGVYFLYKMYKEEPKVEVEKESKEAKFGTVE